MTGSPGLEGTGRRMAPRLPLNARVCSPFGATLMMWSAFCVVAATARSHGATIAGARRGARRTRHTEAMREA